MAQYRAMFTVYERVGFEGRRPSPFSWRVRALSGQSMACRLGSPRDALPTPGRIGEWRARMTLLHDNLADLFPGHPDKA